MNHILSSDMLEGFEHISAIAFHKGSMFNKELQIVTTLEDGIASSVFVVIIDDCEIYRSKSLWNALEYYNN